MFNYKRALVISSVPVVLAMFGYLLGSSADANAGSSACGRASSGAPGASSSSSAGSPSCGSEGKGSGYYGERDDRENEELDLLEHMFKSKSKKTDR